MGMTGPENYKKVEELLDRAEETGEDWFLELAKVHALQANTAAIAMSGHNNGMHATDFEAWDRVCGHQSG